MELDKKESFFRPYEPDGDIGYICVVSKNGDAWSEDAVPIWLAKVLGIRIETDW